MLREYLCRWRHTRLQTLAPVGFRFPYLGRLPAHSSDEELAGRVALRVAHGSRVAVATTSTTVTV